MFGRHFSEAKQTPASMDEFRRSRCVREMATAIILGRTGTEFDEGVLDALRTNVAAAAEEFGVSPDGVQEALEFYGPELEIEGLRSR